MTWCVVEKDKRLNDYGKEEFQIFSQAQWDRYQGAPTKRLDWFRELRVGLFIHFGIAACGKVDIGWSRELHKLPDPGVGKIPTEIYDGWANEFTLENFKAEEWVALAQLAGMKYIVVITKHHDGFHLWDTAYSEHKITRYKANRDYVGELIEACHNAQMPIGLYYSQRDWYHESYEPVVKEDVNLIQEAPFYEYKPGKQFRITEKHEKYIQYMHHAVEELMTKYGDIDFLWWDSAYCNGMYREEMWQTEKIEKIARQHQPNLIINNRGGVPGDFDTPEQRIGMFQNDRPWETCMCLSEEWAWTDKPPKPLNALITNLIQCIIGDGNVLLSMGGKPDGSIPEPEYQRLKEMGTWLKEYGESIYGTRGGPYLPENWGGSCYKDNKVYIHILEPRAEIRLPKLANTIKHIKVLKGHGVDITEKEDCILIKIRESLDETDNLIIELTFEHNF